MGFTRRYLLTEQARKELQANTILLSRQGIMWETSGTRIPSSLKQTAVQKRLQQANAIPRETALELCASISQSNLERWFSLSALRCQRCLADTRDGLPARLRVGFDHRGCRAVAYAYARVRTRPPE